MEVGSLPNAADFFPILGGMDVQGLHKKFLECVTTLFNLLLGMLLSKKENKVNMPKDQLKRIS
ncbi:hypothetical protein FRX31_021904 [Thalictrum thalictroides]|uniref:Uncharacterized protein n=1 Tax=Thalictrum thalictroides TaxID=46969 RepID=A0A7J6VTU4_THATH|nr:hypothetical protein FRX31_021904 [Thalictrum thalictroides]